MIFRLSTLLVLAGYTSLALAQKPSEYWTISDRKSIVWKLNNGNKLPHADNLELSGKRISVILNYSLNSNKELSLDREVYFPQLRTQESGNKRYRAYLKLKYGRETEPSFLIGNDTLSFSQVDSIEFNGRLIFYHSSVNGLTLTRTLFPSMSQRVLVENWELRNSGGQLKTIRIDKVDITSEVLGAKGTYRTRVSHNAPGNITLKGGGTFNFQLYFAAGLDNEDLNAFNFAEINREREKFLDTIANNLILQSSNPTINQLFYFSKIRAAESIFESKMGLVHSPGGGNYYAGIWANDQAEYSGPFFPMLGYQTGQEAATNAYLMYLRNIPTPGKPISSSYEIEGDMPCCGRDRGDAAMIAYGGSQFLLRSADLKLSRRLWPLISWALKYSHSRLNAEGVVLSETDEMEGRISTGDANLSTNALYFGGLVNAAKLARELGEDSLAALYKKRSEILEANIERHFGSNIEGLDTYRYFDGNTYLRHWICLPLVMNIHTRAKATSTALLDKLWTRNGVLVELNPSSTEPNVFWDRGTLYALRGTFKSGFFDRSLEKLLEYSSNRLLSEHVPYPVEAYPENNMKHLSAESALYCRLIIEGMIGFEQNGFRSFTIKPQLSEQLKTLELKRMHIGADQFSIQLLLQGDQIHTKIERNGKKIIDRLVKTGEMVEVSY